MSPVTAAPAVLGVGMTAFGRQKERSLKSLAAEAIRQALADAGLEPADVEMAFVASTVHAVTTGQVAVVGQLAMSEAGIDGIPVYNTENACAGSSAALNLATHAFAAGVAGTVLVVGVEKMFGPDRATTYRALNGAADIEWVASTGVDVERESVFISQVYGGRLNDYVAAHGLSNDELGMVLARIAVKNRGHAVTNERAQFREPITVEEVLAARTVMDPVTTLMCGPTADGATAVVLGDPGRASNARTPVWVRASQVSMGTPAPRVRSTIARVAERAYAQAGLSAADIDLAEVHDATAFSELLAYEELGFCASGAGRELVEAGETSLGGRLPVNTSGGLESRGHPLAATGLAQIVELTTQLRGEAGDRQVPEARVALAETAGGYVAGDSAAVAVTILSTEPA